MPMCVPVIGRTSTVARLLAPAKVRTFAIIVSSVSALAAEEPPPRTPEARMRGALLGALVADALALSTHYEYDAVKIKKFYGAIDRYYAPGEKTGGQTHGIGWGARNFHNGNGKPGGAKRAGENTDYGDYTLLVAEQLAASGASPARFDVKSFLPRWKEAMRGWRSWICTMTRTTLQQVQQGMPLEQLGGNSNAMSFRCAAGVAYFKSEDDAAHCARASMFTHREKTALEGGEFFMRVAHRVAHQGIKPRDAIEAVAAESKSQFIQSKVKQALDKVREATDPSKPLSKEEFADDLALTSMARLWDVGKSEPIKVGKASPTEGTLPGSIYFIVKYQDSLVEAAQANAAVGGDSAARSVAVGAVLGAYLGIDSLPPHLGAGKLVEWDRAQRLLDKMPLLQARSSSVDASEL
mmetsp:Transcript_123852/g.263920  ORF Transcript_123852/g.263920 Transcript_123852/m.263920 type:complete len:409 (-) Transcript_123852:71-1297(-)